MNAMIASRMAHQAQNHVEDAASLPPNAGDAMKGVDMNKLHEELKRHAAALVALGVKPDAPVAPGATVEEAVEQ